MILVAAFVAPSSIGVYAMGTLILTFYQSVTDAAVRQLAVRAIRSYSGRAFLAKYRRWALWYGEAFLFIALGLIFISLPANLSGQVWALSLLLPVPLLSSLRVSSVASMQIGSQWKLLGIYQALSAVLSLLVSVPILLFTGSIWASTSQLLLAELIFTVLVCKRGPQFPIDLESHLETDRAEAVSREFRHLSLYSALGWLQSQADRVLLGVFAGPAALGLYSFAQALSRSVGDALSTSTANVLRPQILKGGLTQSQIRQIVDPLLVRAIRLSGLSTFAVIIIAKLIFPLFMNQVWLPALEATAIMSLAVAPTLLAWCITVILIALGKVRWAAPIKVVGVVLALPIALAAVSDIRLAAFIVVGRDLLIMVLMLMVSRGAISFRVMIHFSGWFIGLVGVCLVFA